MLQLNPPIPVTTPKGKGWAHILIDYSQEHDLLWVVFLDDSRECWTFANKEIRIQSNESLGRHDRKTDLEQSNPRTMEPTDKSVSYWGGSAYIPPTQDWGVIPCGTGRITPTVCQQSENVDPRD
jgi:hypothetical protein